MGKKVIYLNETVPETKGMAKDFCPCALIMEFIYTPEIEYLQKSGAMILFLMQHFDIKESKLIIVREITF
jgi:hypothetical protein